MAASTINLIGLGTPSPLAKLLGVEIGTYAGVGTAQTGAKAITTNFGLLTTSGGATAFVLSTQWAVGDQVTVINTSATAALLYPPSGSAIDGGSTDASVSLAQNIGRMFTRTTSTTWRSANYGSAGSFTTISASGAITPTGGIVAAGGFTQLPNLSHTGGVPPQVSTDGNDSTPSVTETYLCAVNVPANQSVTGISIFNGSATGSGNVTAYLSDSAGNQLAHTASTAITGTDAYQRIAFTATPYAAVGPATYFVLTQYNNTSSRFNTHAFGDFPAGKLTSTTFGTFPTVTIPTTFTANLGPMASLY